MRILITGGGTGGHLYPALAVAEALKASSPDLEVLFVGSERGIEKEQVPEAGFAFRALEVVGFPRRPGLASVRALNSFIRACRSARDLVREYAPDVVFSTGGYASSPVVVGAWLARVPIVLQEQNSVPGLTNRVASRLAAEVHLAFPGARAHFPKRGHLKLSGNPLRAQVLGGSHGRAARLFRLEEEVTTVLVLGGSQGAHSINEAMIAALPRFAGREDIQFLIQTGNLDHERMLDAAKDANVKTWVRRFVGNMGDAYSLADLVLCRAGAMTISELCACGLPSILVPYPHATGNHQQMNAELVRDAGGGVILTDAELTGARVAEEIEALLGDRPRLREMSVNALRLARPDAAATIVKSLARWLPGLALPEPQPALRRADDGPRRGGPRGGDGRTWDRSNRPRPSGPPRGADSGYRPNSRPAAVPTSGGPRPPVGARRRAPGGQGSERRVPERGARA